MSVMGTVTAATQLVLCGAHVHVSFIVTRRVRVAPASSAYGFLTREEGPGVKA